MSTLRPVLILIVAIALGVQRVSGADDIFVAVVGGDVPKVSALLRANPQLVNTRNNLGQTPLLMAAGGLVERPELVALLLKSGADVNVRDRFGDTPLHYAAGRGYRQVTTLLLASGGDLNAKDRYGKTPLKWAIGLTDHRVADLRVTIELLLAHGAEMDIFDAVALGRLKRVRELLAKDPGLIHAKSPRMGNVTLLQVALLRRQKAAADLLISRGAPLDIFAASACSRIDEMQRFLNADPKLISAGGRFGWTPLHWAVRGGQPKAAEYLIAHGANVNAGRMSGATPLHVAAEIGDAEMARLLLTHGADRNAKPLNRMSALTPLQVAMMWHHPEVVKILSKP